MLLKQDVAGQEKNAEDLKGDKTVKMRLSLSSLACVEDLCLEKRGHGPSQG